MKIYLHLNNRFINIDVFGSEKDKIEVKLKIEKELYENWVKMKTNAHKNANL